MNSSGSPLFSLQDDPHMSSCWTMLLAVLHVYKCMHATRETKENLAILEITQSCRMLYYRNPIIIL